MIPAFASWLLALIGWRTAYAPPPGPKSVIIVYPHTSNWDFPLGILFRAKHRVPLTWAGKDTLFRGPLKPLLLWLGGLPINRRERTGMVAQLTAAFAAQDALCICIAPEGTRSRTEHWKSGFYHLALEAGVPLGLGFIDYRTRRLGVERWITLSGDAESDLSTFRAYYADMQGLRPEQAGAIRFKS